MPSYTTQPQRWFKSRLSGLLPPPVLPSFFFRAANARTLSSCPLPSQHPVPSELSLLFQWHARSLMICELCQTLPLPFQTVQLPFFHAIYIREQLLVNTQTITFSHFKCILKSLSLEQWLQKCVKKRIGAVPTSSSLLFLPPCLSELCCKFFYKAVAYRTTGSDPHFFHVFTLPVTIM